MIDVELRYRFRQHQKTDLILGLSYPEAQIATWMNLGMTQDDSDGEFHKR